MSKKNKTPLREWMEAILLAVVIVTFIRIFIFELFAVSSTSMEKSLLAGDFIFVSELHYGPRMPITFFSFPFSHQHLPFFPETKSYWNFFQLPYFRIPGFSEIKHNDVVVFNYPVEAEHPVDQRTYFVKRCVALPGDTLIIVHKKILVDEDEIENPENVQYNYHVKTDSTNLNPLLLYELGINEGGKYSNRGDWQLTMTISAMQRLKQEKNVHEIVEIYEEPNKFSEYIFPNNENFRWNIDNFGPVIIPKSGDSVNITLENLSLYEKIISFYEENELGVNDTGIVINGEAKNFYIFKKNYYFMLGDNRHNSADSRFWGFVPEDHIVGKALFVLFSVDKNAEGIFSRIRWKRCLKKIN